MADLPVDTESFRGGDAFFVWMAALELLLLGLAMRLLPWQFQSPRYDAIYQHLAPLGAVLTISGIALIALQVLPVSNRRIQLALRTAAACVFGVVALGFAGSHNWQEVSTYAFFGLGLLASAAGAGSWLEKRYHVDLFMLVAATERGAYAAMLLLFPTQLLNLSRPLPRGELFASGIAMLFCAGTLVLWQIRRSGAARYVLPILAALPVAVWAYEFGVRENLLAAIVTSGLLAAGIASRPFVPHAWLVPPRKRLVNKLITISTLAIGSALVLIVALQLRETEAAYRERATLDLGVTASVVARESTTFIDENIRQASVMSRDPEILSFDPAVQLAFIQRVLRGEPSISQVVIVDSSGNAVLSSSGGPRSGDLRGQIPGIEHVFQTKEPDWGVGMSPGLKIPVLTVRAPIIAPDGSFHGVYVSQVGLAALTQQLVHLPLGGLGRIIIVDSQGQVIAYPDADLVATRANLSLLPSVAAGLHGNSGPLVYLDGDQHWLSVQVPVGQLGWTVLVERPEAEVLAPAYHAREDSLIALAVVLALTVAGAILLARSLSRPLTELARASESLGDGTAETTLPADREDEVGDLIRAFGRMQQRLVARTRERELAEEERSRLLVREQTARTEVEALLAATASLGVQAEPEAVLRTLVEQAASLLEASSALYAVLRNDSLYIPARWAQGAWHEDGHEPRREGLLWAAWKSGLPYRTNDVSTDPRANAPILQLRGIQSQLSVALIAPDGQHLGLISLNNSGRPDGFSERDERLLLAVCETGGAVLMRARETAARLDAERSAARRKEEVEALLTAADRLNAPAAGPDELLQRVLAVTADLLKVQHAAFVTDEGDHALGRYEWLDGACRPANIRMTLRGSAAGWVMQERRPYRSAANADAEADAKDTFEPSGLEKHVLAVPLSGSDGTVLGVLSFSDPSDGKPFSEDDERLAEGIAHHAAVALERVTLLQELRLREEHLHRQTITDPLTELPNRTLFLQRLSRALGSNRRSDNAVAVLFLDLDGFKTVNDTLGHPAGDELLRAAGRRLVTSQRGEDTVARFGGDEFAVLLASIGQPSDAFIVAERIIREMSRPFSLGDHEVFVTVSVGIAVSGGSSRSSQPEDLLRESDIALYQAKARGKAQFVLFETSMTTVAAEQLELVTELRRAIDGHELRLHYQPFVELASGAVAGTEALLRWKHPRRGFLEPKTFIASMEETGIIVPAGDWVLREACRQAQEWRRRRPDAPSLLMSVNCSAQQLGQSDFVDQVARTVSDSGLQPGSLELEVAEATIMRRPEALCNTLAQLKRFGVRLAIDNFGAGYASLEYVERLAPDRLKIDQRFVTKLDRDSSSTGVVRAVLTLAQALDIEVTAEGVETAEQAAMLRALGCRYGQGYYFSRPVPRRDTTALLDTAQLPLRQGPQPVRAGVQAQGPRNASPA